MAGNAEDRNTELGKSGNKCRKLFRENDLLILLIFLIIFAVVVGSLLIFIIPVLFKKEARPYRLPTDVVPYHYELEVKPYLIPENFEFEGQVEIYIACVRRTDLIVLHSKGLTIFEESIKVTNVEEGVDHKVLLIDYDSSNDLLLLRLLDDMNERRRYRMYIKYKGLLGKGNKGFYITTYEDEQESTHYVASTQFEPDDARTAFPCFDEPAFKSTFNVTLVRWKNMTCLCNMPKIRTEYREEHWEADIFEKSLRMSTYLVAFVFSDYVGTRRGKITVWTPAHKIDKAEFALNVSSRVLPFFENKLEIPYAISKLDMVPVSKLSASAMENWGLIIYENLALLPEEGSEDDIDSLSDIASTVAHEIAHQWFGNLVTPKWWSDIWLSEGITSYMQDLAMITMFPEWHQVDPTIITVYGTIESDCSNAPSLWHSVTSSEEAEKSFEGVTYEKGGMIARMLHHILGEEAFWNGIRRYLKSNSYENVEEADLWRYLTAAQSLSRERLDMAEIMHYWTHLSGIPIVTVHRDYRRKTVTVSQESCKSNMKEHKNDLWNIPLIFETKSAVNLFNNITWLKERNMTIGGMPKEEDWIVVNGDSTGYYLVNYDRKNWDLLSTELRFNHHVFQPTERYKFVTEIIRLKQMGYVEVDTVFQISLYMTEETEINTVSKSVNFIKDYLRLFDENKYRELMTEFIFHNWEYLYERFGWKEDDSNRTLKWTEIDVRSIVTMTLCKLNFPDCIKDASRQYGAMTLVDTDETKPNSVEWMALCTIVQNETYEEWQVRKDVFSKEGEDYSGFVLECSHDSSIIQGELSVHAFFNKSKTNTEWLIMAFSYNEVAFNEFLNFFDKNFQKLKGLGFSAKLFSWRYLKYLNGVNVSRIQQVIRLFNKHQKDLSESDVRNVELFLLLLKKRLPVIEKESILLKNWLERKPWLQL